MEDPQDQANQGQPPPDDGAGQAPGGQSDGQGQNAAPQTFSVDGVEYTIDQVREFAKAKKDYDQFTPVFTQQSQLLKDPEKLDQYLREKFPERFAGQQPDVPQDVKQANEWLRSQGFLTKQDADQMLREAIARDREDAKYESGLEKLESSLDGKDGRPKFDRREVLTHGQKMGIYDPEAAYEHLHRDTLREWYAAEKLGKKPKGLTTEQGGAGLQLPKDEKLSFGSSAMSRAMDRVLESGETAD